ncbi:sterol desaturase family protein [Mucilaginibacter sp. KACC 22063]|uniref:sterol desaturase family protein n=1 Tax=Mucilaginibacter sp. KACC 22063 TaxID=3025666 RepID=UPI00236647DE|nr:sterol desaturase family protein [Mucilaginibacter sp. KACC 22063]WDF56568.1 sterol desaturase family protein [Mucilaginibacter sp. KACC 22063]
MNYLINIGIVLLTIAGMEAMSWGMHKYLFHGPLWFIHKTHHQQRHGWFELNDIFSILFAVISLWLMWVGHFNLDYRLWIGLGISLYGIIYFIFHDWFIHNRFKAFKSNNAYLQKIRRAHKMHHKSTEKWPSEEFGLLVVAKKKAN